MKTTSLLIAGLLALTLPVSAQYVTVGNPGNPNDQDYGYGTGFGAVATTYAIGTYEVTLNQYPRGPCSTSPERRLTVASVQVERSECWRDVRESRCAPGGCFSWP